LTIHCSTFSCCRFKHLEDAAEEEVDKFEDSVIGKIGNGKTDDDSSTEVLDPIGSPDLGFSGGFLNSFFGGMAKARQPWWKG
jgi:hypothetical protein